MATVTPTPAASKRLSRSWLTKSLMWLVPSRGDGLVVLCCSIVAIGLLDPFIDQQIYRYRTYGSLGVGKLGLSLGFSAACLVAVAVALGWRKLTWKSGLLVIASCFVALLGFAWSLTEVTKTWNVGFDLYQNQSPIEEMLFAKQSWFVFCRNTVALTAAGFVILFCLTRGFVLLLERMKSSSSPSIKISRTKLMVGLAVVLFIAKVVQDAYFPMGYLYSFKVYSSSDWLGRVGIGIVAFAFGLLIPSWLLTSNLKARWKALVLFVIVASLVAAYVIRINVVQPRFDDRITTLVNFFVAFMFYVALLVVSKPKSTNDSVGRQSRGLTGWSVLPLILLIGVGWVVYFLDATTLTQSIVFDYPSVNWQRAKGAKAIARASDYQTGIVGRYGSVGIVSNLNDDADPKLYSKLEVGFLAGVNIKGLTPGIDASKLYATGNVILSDSDVTSEQLQGLVEFAALVGLTDVSVVDPDQSVVITGSNQFTVSYSQKEKFGSFVDAIGQVKSGYLHVHLGDEARGKAEVEALHRLGQKAAVYVDKETFEILAKHWSSLERSKSKIVAMLGSYDSQVEFPGMDDPGSNAFQLLMDDSVFVVFSRDIVGDDAFWDLAFAKGENSRPLHSNKLDPEIFNNEKKFFQYANRFHLDFDDDPDQITALFLPGADSDLSAFPKCFDAFSKVETLGLDPHWLNRDDPRSLHYRRVGWWPHQQGYTFAGIEKLTNLKRLDLNPYISIGDEAFLTRIPKIEQLQIRLSKSVEQLVDFRDCPNLKTLVYFGAPALTTINQLRTLNGLESVTVVYGLDDMLSQKSIANIESSIPGVTVKVILNTDYVPTPPAEFTKHAKARSTEIRKRLGVAPQSSK